MSGFASERPYSGRETILICIDIGTQSSAVSFSHLYPNAPARVNMVTQWPGQALSSGAAKISSLVEYENGACKSCGEEAVEALHENPSTVARWFKLHLHPESIKHAEIPPPYESKSNKPLTLEIPPLPQGITVHQVYVDFLTYLFDHTERYFIEKTPGGKVIWQRLRHTIEIVFAIPNGWDYAQQSILRKVAIDAGLVKAETAGTQLTFVTEGEAAVHYCLAYSQTRTWLAKDAMFAVIDAGGSTVDSTLYVCQSLQPRMTLNEVCLSECVQAGGALVDAAVKSFLQRKLEGSNYSDEETISAMVDAFESKTKRLFDGTQTSNPIQFGGQRDNDRGHGILKGRIMLSDVEVAHAFEEVIVKMLNSLRRLLDERKVKDILLVGGFGESPYLKKRLESEFGGKGASIVTVEQPVKKAAAEGAAIWYINRTVVARFAKYTYGTDVQHVYDESKHKERRHLASYGPDGTLRVPDGFSTWVTKGTILNDDYSYQAKYNITWPVDSQNIEHALGRTTVDVYAWDPAVEPIWLKTIYGGLTPGMRHLCTIKADLSQLRNSLLIKKGERKRKYYQANFAVAVKLGGTQLEARLQWYHGDKLCEGPVAIVPNAVD